MFSQACKYGIRATLYLAVHEQEERRVGTTEMAEALDVPKHFLAKILQKLSKNQLISSAKGPNGGFYLSPKNLEATLKDVVLCIDGPDVFDSCILGLPVCSSENPCPLHVQAYAYREGLHYQLKHQAIGELAKRIERDELQL